MFTRWTLWLFVFKQCNITISQNSGNSINKIINTLFKIAQLSKISLFYQIPRSYQVSPNSNIKSHIINNSMNVSDREFGEWDFWRVGFLASRSVTLVGLLFENWNLKVPGSIPGSSWLMPSTHCRTFQVVWESSNH